MAWYDLFSNFYDVALDGTYRSHREQASSALQLTPGMNVVDVGCGTGASFPALVKGVGAGGRVVGVDTSIGMLRKAEGRVRRNAWKNVQVVHLDPDDPIAPQKAAGSIGEVDRVLCFLSLSVIPNWQAVLAQWLSVLAPGGRLVIADVHSPQPGPYGRLVEVISRATLSRKSWEPLKAQCTDFELSWQASSWVLGGQFFVAGANSNSSPVKEATRPPAINY